MRDLIKEVLMDQDGESVGTKELRSEIIDYGSYVECVTRETVRLYGGKVVINHVIHRTKWKKEANVNE